MSKVLFQYNRTPGTRYFADNPRQVADVGLSGHSITLAINPNLPVMGNSTSINRFGHHMMSATAYTIEDVEHAIPDLQRMQINQHRFFDIILSSGYAAGMSFFDDTRWNTVLQNLDVYAQVAARGGVNGFTIDPEDYSGVRLFQYSDQNAIDPHPLEDYKTQAYLRGQQVMQTILNHVPAPVILALYGYSMLYQLPVRYELLPSFYDGMLIEMPDDVFFVDGWEFSYSYKNRSQFVNARTTIANAREFSATPTLYDEKIRVGFATWLNYQLNPNYFTYYQWFLALQYALKLTDQYVWIYTNGTVGFFPLVGIDETYIWALQAAQAAVED